MSAAKEEPHNMLRPAVIAKCNRFFRTRNTPRISQAPNLRTIGLLNAGAIDPSN
jgi:hypothetical protein